MANETFPPEGLENLDLPPELQEALMEASHFPEFAEAYRLQGKIEEAIKICTLGLHKRPDNIKGRFVLGRCYFDKGLFKEAKVELERVKEEIEGCLLVYKLLSLVYLQEKEVERALEALRKALLWPEAEEKSVKGLTPLEINIWQKKIEPLISSPQPKAPETFHTETMAQIYLKQGRKEKALEIYRELLARDPANKVWQEKYNSLALSLEEEKRKAGREEVIRHLEKWLAKISGEKK